MRVDGNFTFRGGSVLDLVRVNGNFTFRGGLVLDLARVDGSFTFRGGLMLDLVRVDGDSCLESCTFYNETKAAPSVINAPGNSLKWQV